MHLRTLLATVFVFLATADVTPAYADSAQADGLQSLGGEWIYLEDRTEGRPLERLGPPMSAKFSLSIEDDAVVLVRGHGSGHRNVRVAIDGSTTDVPGAKEGTFVRYRGSWKDGTFTYETTYARAPGQEPAGLLRKELRMTKDGLLVRVTRAASTHESVGLYRHAEDIEMPTPAKAVIGDLDWLAGAWVGTRGRSGTTSIEERWSPPLGGAMLAVSRTVSGSGKMTGFEYLRIVERDGGLVYIAQPGGSSPTEFVLSELTAKRCVFDNPRHDYPKRIVYQLSDEGALNVSIGFMKGGSPRRFAFKREGA